MRTLSQEIKTISGKFIQSGVTQSIHPVTVFWMWLRFRLIIGFVLIVTHIIAAVIGAMIR